MKTLITTLRQMAPRARLMADSRQVAKGDVFLAFAGQTHDGRTHIAAAVAAGAAAIVWEPEGFTWPLGLTVPNVAWPGLAKASAELAVAWYADPSAALWTIGVTGTNGKTSCTHGLAQVLTTLGRKTALVGTLGNGFVDALTASSHTTPDAVSLQGLLAEYQAQGATALAMEVSSHALDQGRVAGMHFAVAVLTNLSRDHLDYHGDMAAYAAAKARLFAWPGLKVAVLNSDDALGQQLAQDLAGRDLQVLTYGIGQGDIRAEGLHMDASGNCFTLVTPNGEARIASPLLGRFNVENLLACAAALLASDVPLLTVAEQLGNLEAVPGRLQVLRGEVGDPLVVIDYAHTPDALEKVLATLRPFGRLCCIFGCGGDRDRGKRPLMGAAVAAGADMAIVTSDNPRHEEANAIIADIVAAMPAGQRVIVDRATAIFAAIAEATADGVVLIAGKGHEAYQEIAGVRYPFSDLAVARQALAMRKEKHALV
jgi:UDP-N-acetylmuramoyl-L-alanyl-D-glutamate--2,6-diaminopimelate ligase